MAVHPLRNVIAVSRPQEPKNQIRPFSHREITETVNAAVLPNPIAGAHVVSVFRFVIAREDSLLRRKEAVLGLGDLVQIPAGLASAHSTFPYCIIPEIITGFVRLDRHRAQAGGFYPVFRRASPQGKAPRLCLDSSRN